LKLNYNLRHALRCATTPQAERRWSCRAATRFCRAILVAGMFAVFAGISGEPVCKAEPGNPWAASLI